MVVEGEPQEGEGKRNEQDQGESSLHGLTMVLTGGTHRNGARNLLPLDSSIVQYNEKRAIVQVVDKGKGISKFMMAPELSYE